MKQIAIGLVVGLGLIATAIYLKPTEPVLACANNGCAYLKGKHLFILQDGKNTRFNLITSQVSEVKIQKVRR